MRFPGQRPSARQNAIQQARRRLLGSEPPAGPFETLRPIPSEAILRTSKGHAGPVLTLAFSANGRRLASGGSDSAVKVWDLASELPPRELIGHRSWVQLVRFSKDGRFLLSRGHDGTSRIWDLCQTDANPQERFVLPRNDPGVFANGRSAIAAYSPDGKFVATGGFDTKLQVVDARTAETRFVLSGSGTGVWSLEFAPDGQLLASGGLDGKIRLWNTADGTEKTLFKGHNGWIYGLAFSPDGRTLVSTSEDDSLRLWNIELGTEINRYRSPSSEPIRSLGFSKDGRYLVAGTAGGSIHLLDFLPILQPHSTAEAASKAAISSS